MRIWHEQLIPLLCQKHLCACWREGLGAYKIITENKKGYSNHPAIKEFENAPIALWDRLDKIRKEMLARGYNPKELRNRLEAVIVSAAKNGVYNDEIKEDVKQWQTLDEQIAHLKTKNCKCNI